MKSFLSYLGGKSLLAGRIVEMMPPHTCYCEVFAGAAWLLFKKAESKVEIINDINADLVILYRVVQNHLEEFVRYLKWILIARNEFNRFKIANPETLTDIQWAVRFYCLLKMAYNSKIPNQFFRVSKKRQQSLNLLRIEEELSAVHRRLARVYIENMHYADLIRRFDGPETFFYVAPPYYGLEDYYGKDIFHREDFGILRDLLTTINGKFIMSINDTPEIRELFKGFNVSTAATNYKSIGKIKRVSELLITNYEPAASTRTCGLF